MRHSRHRDLILEIVRMNPVHPTAEWVFEQARKEMPSIGIATVYRNLNQLADAGMIGRIAGVDGAERYDGKLEHHYHLKCRHCGRLFDLMPKKAEAAERVEELVKEIFSVEATDICVNAALLEGLCAECREEA